LSCGRRPARVPGRSGRRAASHLGGAARASLGFELRPAAGDGPRKEWARAASHLGGALAQSRAASHLGGALAQSRARRHPQLRLDAAARGLGTRRSATSLGQAAGPLSGRRQVLSQEVPSMATSKEQAVKDYADFEDKVKRTIYIDQLSPQVTNPVIKAALAQCANVVSVEFIVNYTIPYDIPSAALVELDDEMQAKAAVELMNDFPFIIGGMPRPVKAIPARPEMFRDRPPRPGIKKDFRWVKQGDDEFETMKKLKILAKRQEAENMALIKTQLEEEKELAKQQQDLLDGNCKKYDMLETVMQNGAIKKLAHRYGVNLDDF
ncbi:hypothetical protein EJB05_40279, partial [Eragrostis curvula]